MTASMNAAMAYIDRVRATFLHECSPPQEHVLKEFMAMLKDTQSGTDMPTIIGRMIDIFHARRNARELITGFNTFLPAGYQISFPAHEYVPTITYPPGVTGPYAKVPKPPIDPERHCQFVGKIKSRFAKVQPEQFALYLELLQRYRELDEPNVEELHLHTAAIFQANATEL